MERLTSIELGFVLCAINGEIHRLEHEDNTFAYLRKEQLQSIYKRLDKSYRNEDKRIAIG